MGKGEEERERERERETDDTHTLVLRTKCTKMALVHDLAECITGDFVPEDGLTKEEKFEKEWDAMSRLRDLVKSSSLGEGVHLRCRVHKIF